MKKLGTVTILNEKKFGKVRAIVFTVNDETYYALVTTSGMTREDLYKALKSFGVEYINRIPLKMGVVHPHAVHRGIISIKGMEIDKRKAITMDEECLVNKLRQKYETWVDGNSGFAARNYLRIKFDAERKKILNFILDTWKTDIERKVEEELSKVSDECCVVKKFFGVELGSEALYFLEREEIEVEDLSPLQSDIEKFEKECRDELAAAVYKEYGPVLEDVEFGPYEKIKSFPSEHYVVIYMKRTKLTADHRQNRFHTYAYWAIKKGTKGVVEITLPKYAPIGKIIGKGGENIKKIAKEIGCKYIKIKKEGE